MGDRHQFRAKWHDYNRGIYFVTICAAEKQHIFGAIRNNIFFPSELGDIITSHIELIPSYHKEVEIWKYVVMPNHIHIVIAVGTRLIASAPSPCTSVLPSESQNKYGCLKPPRHGDTVNDYHHNSKLATIIGAFKAGVTRTARTRLIASLPCWQSRYHEYIIRNQHAFDNIMYYIDTNVENWNNDCFAK